MYAIIQRCWNRILILALLLSSLQACTATTAGRGEARG